MPGLVSTSLGAAAVVLLAASLFLPQAFGTTSLLPSLELGCPKKNPPRSKDSQEANDNLACSRKGHTTKEKRACETKYEELAEESTKNRENGNEEKVESDEGEKGGPREEAAEGQEDERALDEEPGRADGMIIIEVLVIEVWFRVPIAEVPVEEGAEELEIIRYWTSLDILTICNCWTHELYPLFSDADGRCRWH